MQQRLKMQQIMDLLVLNRVQIHWNEIRPMGTRYINDIPSLNRAISSPQGLTMDCSESVTLICKLAGLIDPNGNGYNGLGYTGTMLSNARMGHYTDVSRCLPGAIIVFGGGTGRHVCMVYHSDPLGHNPMLFSHGMESDPSFVPFSREIAYFRGAYTCLDISEL